MNIDKEILQETGIYYIKNKKDNNIYIGSAKRIRNRLFSHRGELKNNRHGNPHLQRAWNKYGSENFECGVIELCSNEEKLIREKYWINYYVEKLGRDNVYNSILDPTLENRAADFTENFFKEHPDFGTGYETIMKIIDDLENTTLTYKELEEKYKVKHKTIASIYNRISYTELTKGKIFHKRERDYSTTNYKMSKEEIEEIFRLATEENLTRQEIAKKLNKSFSSISGVLTGEHYSNYSKDIDKTKVNLNIKSTHGAIVQYNIFGEEINRYDSVFYIPNTTKHIIFCNCRKNSTLAYGSIWRYADEIDLQFPTLKEILYGKRTKKVYLVIRYNKDNIPLDSGALDYFFKEKPGLKKKIKKQNQIEDDNFIYKLSSIVPDEDLIYLIKKKYKLDDNGNPKPLS